MARTNFEKLCVYQLSEQLADEIWNTVMPWPALCEGHGRQADGESGGQHRCQYC